MIRPLATLFVAILGVSLFGCGNDAAADSSKTLRFSAIPDETNKTAFEEKFGRVADWLSKELGIDVEYVHASSYAASVEQFKAGDIQLAWFGGLTGVQARAAVKGARAIVQGDVDPHYYSYFVANADTGLTKSESFPDIKGKRFTFGSPSSTSGRLMPEYFIRQNTGQSPEEYFGHKNEFSGAHDKTCELVADGTYDVGALSYKTYDKLVKAGKLDPEKCRVIWQTPGYADYNMTAHPKLEEMFGAGFTEKLQAKLIEMSDPKLLEAFQRDDLIAAKNEDFSKILETAKQLELVR